MSSLTLTGALKAGRIADFIVEQEARVGPIEEADFDALAAKMIRTERSSDQTSLSLNDDGSRGKLVRPDNSACAAMKR